MEDNGKVYHQGSIYHAILELKKQQDLLGGCPNSCYSNLLSKLLKVDTIPLLLYTEDGLFHLSGSEDKNFRKCEHFCTPFFRIEHVDIKKNCCTISLLRPLSLSGVLVEEICDVERLERTNICVKIDLSCFCAVQCLDINLLKKVVIEPKW